MITFEQAMELVQMENTPFYYRTEIIENYTVYFFNYRLAEWADFQLPNALYMRGLVFVEDEIGNKKCFPNLKKFFNFRQAPETQEDVLRKRKITSVQTKEDGSIISFIQLPNGSVFAKSKMSVLLTDQAKVSQQLYLENLALQEFIDWTFKNDLTAIFELVSPNNKVVLEYSETELILLKLLDCESNPIPLESYPKLDQIKYANFYTLTLDEIIDLGKTQNNVEGYVVDFDGVLVKFKTKWYYERHGFITEDSKKENIIIKYIINEQIDDFLPMVYDQPEILEFINHIERIVKFSIRRNVLIDYNKYVVVLNAKNQGWSNTKISLTYPKLSHHISYFRRKNVIDYIYQEEKKKILYETRLLKDSRAWLNENEKLYVADMISRLLLNLGK